MLSFLKKFTRSSDGSIALLTALAAIPLMGMAGFAVDYGRWQYDKAELQAITDASALAGAMYLGEGHTNTADVKAVVKTYVDANASGYYGPVTVKGVQVQKEKGEVEVTLSTPGKRAFSAMFLTKDPIISTTATAISEAEGVPVCVLALDPSMDKALEQSGGSSISAPDCRIQVNSSSSKAVNLTGGATIKSKENCFVGGVASGLSGITPSPEPSCSPIADPFASMPKPTVGTCDYTNYSANKTGTLNPGVYCGGMKLSDQTFTLNPGLYIIKDGEFVSSGGATIKGNGVTFYLVGSGIGVTWSGGGNYQFKASATGPLAGFVVYMDPYSTPKDKSHISGGGDTFYEGVMYFPKQKLEISGGGSMTTPSPFTSYVAKNFLFSGGSTLNIKADATLTDLPLPSGVYTKFGSPRLIN